MIFINCLDKARVEIGGLMDATDPKAELNALAAEWREAHRRESRWRFMSGLAAFVLVSHPGAWLILWLVGQSVDWGRPIQPFLGRLLALHCALCAWLRGKWAAAMEGEAELNDRGLRLLGIDPEAFRLLAKCQNTDSPLPWSWAILGASTLTHILLARVTPFGCAGSPHSVFRYDSVQVLPLATTRIVVASETDCRITAEDVNGRIEAARKENSYAKT